MKPIAAAGWFFCILLAYSIVRPIRELFGSIGDADRLAKLMIGTVVTMIVLVPLYSIAVSRLSRRNLVSTVYHFFALSLVGFAIALSQAGDTSRGIATVFFVWVNVFGFYATSVFWSVMVDITDPDSAKQSFGRIAAGGTAGAIVGSAASTILPYYIARPVLLLIPAVVLEIGLLISRRLETDVLDNKSNRRTQDDADLPNRTGLAGSIDGVVAIAKSPYLMMIALYLVIYQAAGTTLYFYQREIVADSIADLDARTSFFASLDFGTQLLTLAIQSLLTPIILKHLGVAVALVSLPIVCAVCYPVLATMPTLWTLAAVMIATRAIGYGVTVPSREVLFSVVPTAQKYKSKIVIDTVVLRGSDAGTSSLIRAAAAWQISMATILWIAAPITILWAAIAALLGWRYRSKTPS